MTNEFEEDQRRFEAEMNQWIAKQGLMTQLRLGWTRGGALGILARVTLFCFLIAGIGAAIGFFWLNNHLNGGGFKGGLAQSLNQYLSPEKPVVIAGGRTQNGAFKIDRLEISKPKNAFFKSLVAREIIMPIELGQGVWRPWGMGAIEVGELELELHTSAPNPEVAGKMLEPVMERSKDFSFNAIRSKSIKLGWQGTRAGGEITGTKANFLRDGEGWLISFEEGSIDYVWLDGLKLGETRLRLDSKGLQINRMEIIGPMGTVEVSGKIRGGVDPEFDLKLKIDSLQIDELIAEQLQSAVSGVISGEGRITGNLDAGVTTEIDLMLQPANGDYIAIWNVVPVLDAMSYLDPSGRYARLPLVSGSAKVIHEKNRCTFENVNFRSQSGARVEGSFIVRPPSKLEMDKLMELDGTGPGAGVLERGIVVSREGSDSDFGSGDRFNTDKGTGGKSTTPQQSEAEQTIEKLRKEALAEGKVGKDELLAQKQNLNRVLALQKRRVLDGQIRFGVSPEVIRRQPIARKLFEQLGDTYWIEFPLEGEVRTVGYDVSQKIREISRNRVTGNLSILPPPLPKPGEEPKEPEDAPEEEE